MQNLLIRTNQNDNRKKPTVVIQDIFRKQKNF